VYAEETGKTYLVTRAVPLHKTFKSEGATVLRELNADESLEVLDGPHEEKSNVTMRIRCRAVSDGKTGWTTQKSDNLKRWFAQYKCVSPTPFQEALGDSKILRQLEAGELVEVLEGPLEDSVAGVLRVRSKAEKDGVVGWLTISSKEGKRHLDSAAKKD